MTCCSHSTARGWGQTPEPLSSKQAWHKGPCPPSARGHPYAPSALHFCRVNAPSVSFLPQDFAPAVPQPSSSCSVPSPREPPQAAPLHSALPMNSGQPGPSTCTLYTCAPVPCTPAHLAPGPHCPLCAGLCVAGLRAVGSQRLLAQAWLWAGHQTLLLAAATSLGALPPGGGVPAEAGLGSAVPAGGRLGGPWLAVEGPQRPKVPSVHTQHVPHRDTAAAATGALGPHRAG